MTSGVTEHGDEDFRRGIDDTRVIGKVRCRVHNAVHIQDTLYSI